MNEGHWLIKQVGPIFRFVSPGCTPQVCGFARIPFSSLWGIDFPLLCFFLDDQLILFCAKDPAVSISNLSFVASQYGEKDIFISAQRMGTGPSSSLEALHLMYLSQKQLSRTDSHYEMCPRLSLSCFDSTTLFCFRVFLFGHCRFSRHQRIWNPFCSVLFKQTRENDRATSSLLWLHWCVLAACSHQLGEICSRCLFHQ